MASALGLKVVSASYGSIDERDKVRGPFTIGDDFDNTGEPSDRVGSAGIPKGLYVRCTAPDPDGSVSHNMLSQVHQLWIENGGAVLTGGTTGASDPLARVIEVSFDTDDIIPLPDRPVNRGADNPGYQDVAPSSLSVNVAALHVEREIEILVNTSGAIDRAYLSDLAPAADYVLPA